MASKKLRYSILYDSLAPPKADTKSFRTRADEFGPVHWICSFERG